MHTEFLNDATEYLKKTDTDLATLITRVGPCDLRLKPECEPYEALIRAITHQQLHGRAAEAILKRFLALFPGVRFPLPLHILEQKDNVLRGCGLSATKVFAIRGIAVAAQERRIPTLHEARELSDICLIERLTVLRGVGRWTVEMFLMFTLARPDILPVDDFGVREGWRLIKSLSAQPKPRELADIGRVWSPYRSVAARYLWHAVDVHKKIINGNNNIEQQT